MNNGTEITFQGFVFTDVNYTHPKSAATEFLSYTVAEGLKKLFEEDWFDVLKFNRLCNICEIVIPPLLNDMLFVLHCSKWSEMDSKLSQDLKDLIKAIFSGVTNGKEVERTPRSY